MNINTTNFTCAAVFPFASYLYSIIFIEIKNNNSIKTKINKWVVKFVLFVILKKVLIIFTTNLENVNSVILNEVQDDILKTKKEYQININYIMKKIEISYLQGLKYINETENLTHNK